ncbi:hypothetical protein [Deltalipothrixvirus pozzuoliense]|uniref:Uncharacterized protein ORF208 n=1 Tax=Acidianus filamentous virus 2 (isolate Italy/Pozzuoli) TaxID=654910 RepID=Y208_AFV2P|nr:hypothetical protein AFV2_gp48 [Acidianus filamentous virus 2]Q573C1.1 RecName: Full=Uncharacterized protein ORF208 [Acidianus filamentous virus 2 (isolate Pozzuoli)]CAH69435.1 hypothetical protein [Acidianus filamentous virus 2]
MKVVTFGGHFHHFREIYDVLHHDVVIVDDNHLDGVTENTFDNVNITHYKTNVDDNKNVSIAKTLIYIYSTVNDDVIVLDSDVYVPIRDKPLPNSPTIFCIPAVNWGNKKYVLYCDSTNVFVPRLYLNPLVDMLELYLKGDIDMPIDTYQSRYTIAFNKIVVPGTFHYLPSSPGDYANTKKWVVTSDDILSVNIANTWYSMLPCDYVLK